MITDEEVLKKLINDLKNKEETIKECLNYATVEAENEHYDMVYKQCLIMILLIDELCYISKILYDGRSTKEIVELHKEFNL